MKDGSHIAVLLGDVVQSRRQAPDRWLPVLKQVLGTVGSSPQAWETSRGDSFQVRIAQPEKAIGLICILRAGLRTVGVDARIGLGIGEEAYKAPRVGEANGMAYILAAEAFDRLGKGQLYCRTPLPKQEKLLNGLLMGIDMVIEGWSAKEAVYAQHVLLHPQLTQKEVALQLNYSPSTISGYHSRTHIELVLRYQQLFNDLINNDADVC